MESKYQQVINELSKAQKAPCVSIYLATTSGKNGCDETILRFKNLKRKVLASLRRGYDSNVVEDIEIRLDTMERDVEFWSYQRGGVAVFLAPDVTRVEKLRRPLDDAAVVADRFYLKPLIYLFQTLDQFAVLAISMNHVRLYVGDRDKIEAEEIRELNVAFNQFWGEPNIDRRMVSLAVGSNGSSAGKSRSLFHNYDDVHARKKVDLKRYFAAIDRIVCDVLAGNISLPVVLATLPEYQDLYRSKSKIRRLVERGVLGNPDVMSADELREKAWQLISHDYDTVCAKLNDEYSNAVNVGRASDHLQEIAKAITHGRVGKLLIEEDRVIPGRLVKDAGLVMFADLENPHVNDLLDDFADIVVQNSGVVTVLPREKMPTDTGIAAIYRY